MSMDLTRAFHNVNQHGISFFQPDRPAKEVNANNR